MIDVEARVFAQPSDDKVDEALECGLLLRAVESPERLIFPLASIAETVTEKIFKTSLANEWVAFEIEENVPFTGLREKRQADPGSGPKRSNGMTPVSRA